MVWIGRIGNRPLQFNGRCRGASDCDKAGGQGTAEMKAGKPWAIRCSSSASIIDAMTLPASGAAAKR